MSPTSLFLFFPATVIDNLDATTITNTSAVKKAAKLMEVGVADLTEALTTKTLFTRGESVTSTMSAAHSMDVRDAFVKGECANTVTYHRLVIFVYIPGCMVEPLGVQSDLSSRFSPQISSISVKGKIFGLWFLTCQRRRKSLWYENSEKKCDRPDCGTVEPHFRTAPSIGPPLPTDQPPESLPTYSNGILTPLVGPPSNRTTSICPNGGPNNGFHCK